MDLDEFQPPVDPADVRDGGELVDGRIVVMKMPEWVGTLERTVGGPSIIHSVEFLGNTVV